MHFHTLREGSQPVHRSFPRPVGPGSGLGRAHLSPECGKIRFSILAWRAAQKRKLRTCTPGQPNAHCQFAAMMSDYPHHPLNLLIHYITSLAKAQPIF